MKRNTLILLSVLMTFNFSALAVAAEETPQEKWSAFYGFVEKMPIGLYGTWVFNGRPVRVSPQTRVEQSHGLATIGSYAEVMGISRGGTFYATTIEIEPGGKFWQTNSPQNHRHHSGSFQGTINELPPSGLGHWMIDEHRVLVDKLTRIEETQGRVAAGVKVAVEGYYRNTTFYARLVEVK